METTRPLLLGRYQVIKHLEGGMGIVYVCLDSLDPGRPIALKTFKPELMANLDSRKRFLQEGSVWISLGFHPNIVEAFRVHRDDRTQIPYLALELVPSPQGMPDPSLRSWLRTLGPLPLPRALLIVLGVTRGMEFASSKIPGLVHRDLKPENILIGPDGSPRITDFGLASVPKSPRDVQAAAAGQAASPLTRGAVGTPLYMSPEQWRAETLDERADIYSLGLVMLEMFNGKPVVVGSSLTALAEAHVRGMALELAQRIDLPRGLGSLAASLVHPERASRVASWSDLEANLLQLWPQLFSSQAPEDSAPADVGTYGEIRRGESFLAIGGAYLDIGDPHSAGELFMDALAIGQQQRYPPLVAAASANQGVLHAEIGRFQDAIPLYEEAIALFRAIGLEYQVAMNTGNLGNAHFALGHLPRAQQLLEAALGAAQMLQDHEGVARWLGNLGNVAIARGEISFAHSLFREAFQKSEESGNKAGMTAALLGLALVRASTGNPREAIHLCSRALELAEGTADRRSQSLAAGGIGSAQMRLGQPQLAAQYFQRALEIAGERGDLWLQATSLGNLAAAHVALGKHDVALDEIQTTINIAESIGARDIAARAKWSAGIALLTAGSVREAMPRLRIALREYRQLGMPEYSEASLQLQELEARFAGP